MISELIQNNSVVNAIANYISAGGGSVLLQMMEGCAVGAVILMPISLKWEIEQRIAVAGAFIFGLASGTATYFIQRIFALSLTGRLSLNILLIALFSFISAALMFYRDPERTSATGMSDILSPADGTVLYVKRIKKGRVPLSTKKGRSFMVDELAGTAVLDRGVYLVGIGMNLLNVHVNRAPIEGEIKLTRPVRGSFFSLKKDDAVLLNERRTTVIDNGKFSVGVIQIASRLVRRIESYVDEGQTVAKGERIGIIHFGSQVDLVLPRINGLEVPIKPGDRVWAGETVIAKTENISKNLRIAKKVAKNNAGKSARILSR